MLRSAVRPAVVVIVLTISYVFPSVPPATQTVTEAAVCVLDVMTSSELDDVTTDVAISSPARIHPDQSSR